MKVIIAGSRNIKGRVGAALVEDAMEHVQDKLGWTVTEIVSGHARGIDKLGEAWGYSNNIPQTIFRADWEALGKRAGFIRNEQMAKYADALVAVWNGKSKGTEHMINLAKKHKLKIYVEDYTYGS